MKLWIGLLILVVLGCHPDGYDFDGKGYNHYSKGAYDAGQRAAKSDLPADSNPYRGHDYERSEAWFNGYLSVKEEEDLK